MLQIDPVGPDERKSPFDASRFRISEEIGKKQVGNMLKNLGKIDEEGPQSRIDKGKISVKRAVA